MRRGCCLLLIAAVGSACGGGGTNGDLGSTGSATAVTSVTTTSPTGPGTDSSDVSSGGTGSTSAGSTTDGTATTGVTGATTMATDTTATTTDATTDTGADPSIPICWIACSTAADCSQGTPGWDEDNYQCDGGKCVYQGCNGDTECQAQGNYVCKAQGTATEYCLPGCSTADDCNLGTPDFDADNYACDGGACVYQGCNSDAECQQKGSFLCRDTAAALLPGFEGVSTCVPACSTADDCNQGGGAYDADNYDCIDGACIWTGCNSSDECGAGQVCE